MAMTGDLQPGVNPRMHAQTHRENVQTLQRKALLEWDSNPGPSYCEATVLSNQLHKNISGSITSPQAKTIQGGSLQLGHSIGSWDNLRMTHTHTRHTYIHTHFAFSEKCINKNEISKINKYMNNENKCFCAFFKKQFVFGHCFFEIIYIVLINSLVIFSFFLDSTDLY